MHPRPLSALSLASFLLAAHPTVSAGDWPQWRGAERTGHAATDEKPLLKLPDAARVRWKIPATEGYASPVVAAGRVFVVEAQEGQEVLRSLVAATGHELWRTVIDETHRDSQGPAAPRCTPVISQGLVFAQSCRGTLACLRVADGLVVWQVNYSRNFGATFIGEKGNAQGATRHGNNGAPWVETGSLFASAGSTNGAAVVALDPSTGKVRWKGGNEVAAYAAPMVGTLGGVRQVVDFMSDATLGLDASNGSVLWRHPMKTAFGRHVMTPILHGDQVIVGSHQNGLVSLRIARTADGWTATESWNNKDAAPNFSCPVLVGGHVYGLGPQKDVVCVDAATGKTAWTKSGWVSSSADKAHAGFVAVANQSILMLSDSGELILFAADPAGCRELGRLQACGANWCNPAYVDGKLYLRDGLKAGGNWICLDLGS